MLKFGTISEVNGPLARVVFDDELQSDWLPAVVNKAGTDSYFYPMEAGEFVACLMDEQCENGVILGAVYAGPVKVKTGGPGITAVTFSDGASVVYDSNKGELALTASKVAITGELTVSGDVRAGVGPLGVSPLSVSLLKHFHQPGGPPPLPTPV